MTAHRQTRAPSQDPARVRDGWVAAAIAALSVAFHLRTISLPLTFDDAWSIRLVDGYTIPDAFLRTANFGYYRPLYLLGYMLGHAAGGDAPVALHALCIAVATFNAVLLMRFVRATHGRPDLTLEALTGLFFVFSPFAVQAVALPAGLNHLLALMFSLLAVSAYGEARKAADEGRSALRPGALCGAFCVLAFLSNEVGVTVFAFCLAYEAARAWRDRLWTRRAWSFLAILALCAAYYAGYQLIPKGTPPERILTPENLATNALFASQGLSYVAAHALGAQIANGPAAVMLAAVPTAALIALALRGARRYAALAGLIVFAVASLPPIVFLPSGYLLNSPRPLYVALAGATLTLAAVARTLVDVVVAPVRERRNVAALLAATAAGLAVAAPIFVGARHHLGQANLYAAAHEPADAIAWLARIMRPNERAVVLNMPEWVASPDRDFPMGTEGAIVMAPYVEPRDIALANTGLRRDFQAIQFPTPFQPELAYAHNPFGTAFAGAPDALNAMLGPTTTQVLRTTYESAGPRTAWLGTLARGGGPARLATFGDNIALIDVAVAGCRGGWMIAPQWLVLPGSVPMPTTMSVFAQALGPAGEKLAQKDGAPLGGLAPFHRLPEGTTVHDRRALDTAGQRPSTATLFIGLYDYETGVRMRAAGPDGTRLAGDGLGIPLPPMTDADCR